MSPGETAYLALVVAGFLLFAGIMMWVSHPPKSHR